MGKFYELIEQPDGGMLLRPAELQASVVHRIEVPWMSQLGPAAAYSNNDCGPACVGMILRGRGQAATVDQCSVATGLPRSYGYTLPEHLIKAAAAFNLRLERDINLTLASLKAEVDRGRPTIVLVHYATLVKRWDQNYKAGHWVLFTGYDEAGTIFYHDPYWPDSTGQFLPLPQLTFLQAMLDCEHDGNAPHQGLRIAAA